MQAQFYDDLASLPEGYSTLLASAGKRCFQAGAPWFALQLGACLEPGDRPRLLAIEDAGGRPALLLPLRRCARAARFRGTRELASACSVFTTRFEPPSPAGACAAAWQATAASLREADGYDVLDLNALPRDGAAFAALRDALAAAGFIVRPYFHFGNWYEAVGGIGFEDYMARRPSALRNTVRRKRRSLEREHVLEFPLWRDAADLQRAIETYERVYAASWKTPEPYPGFMPGLIRAAAAAGALRLGACLVDGVPAAVQLWLVAGGRATIFKLAYDERFRDASVGSLLTAEMARHALEADRVEEIDFGRGDDAYKRDWLAERRERWGLLAFHPRRPRALAAAALQGLAGLRPRRRAAA